MHVDRFYIFFVVVITIIFIILGTPMPFLMFKQCIIFWAKYTPVSTLKASAIIHIIGIQNNGFTFHQHPPTSFLTKIYTLIVVITNNYTHKIYNNTLSLLLFILMYCSCSCCCLCIKK